MREYVATVTSKGQMTIPAGVRRSLGIEPGDRVAIVVSEAHAEVRRLPHSVTSVFGMIPTPPGLVTDDFDDLIEEAMSDHADEFVRRMREGTLRRRERILAPSDPTGDAP